MRSIFQHLSLSLCGLLLTACSQSGAEAQSVATEPTQKPVQTIQSDWSVDKSASSLSFSGSMNGDAFLGNFSDFDAWIMFDPDNLENAHIKVSVAMNSVDASDAERTEALPGKEWFGVKTFPLAVFESATVKKTNDNLYEAIGELTIKDVKLPKTLPFSLDIEDGIASAAGKITINRTDFGVGTGMWKNEDFVAHKVEVKFAVKAIRK